MRDTKSIVMSIRLEEDTAAHLQTLAKREDVPMSLFIRRILKDAVKRLLPTNGKKR